MTKPPPRIAILGAHGQVALALARTLPGRGFHVTILARPAVDLRDPQSVTAALTAARPDIVVNPAAYTAVDRAEDEADLATAINRDGAGHLSAITASLGIPLIHISTDYVFDGAATRPYLETDPTNPLGVYGRSKLEGEIAVARANPAHVILRTSWVASPDGANFVKTMLRLATERDELRVVDDQHGAPTFAADIATAVAHIALQKLQAGSADPRNGIFHCTSAGATTWCGFARAIMAGAAARGHRAVPVTAITTKDFPTRAARPGYSVLDSGKLARAYGIPAPDWPTSLARCLDALIGPCTPATAQKGATS